MTTMQIDRAVVEQALEALEAVYGDSCDAIHALRAALAQQDEPVGSVCARCGALAFDPVVPQQAEPLNLTDPAVRKRLATQWGYVPAAQAEPVKPVATLTAQRDALLEALKEVLAWGTDQNYVRAKAACDKARAAIKAVEETK